MLVTAMYFLSCLSMMQSEQPTLLTNCFCNTKFVKDNVILLLLEIGENAYLCAQRAASKPKLATYEDIFNRDPNNIILSVAWLRFNCI